jgi:hypothetical protein
MNKSNFKNEYLFILGNGASIASADPRIEEFIKKKLSIENFVDALDEINQNRWNVDFCKLFDRIMDHSYIQNVQRIIEISKEKGTNNIVKLLANLKEDEYQLDKKKAAANQGENENMVLQAYADEVLPILEDIKALICVVYITISSYYKEFERKYFLKLWRVIRETRSPVISLNWDINFERVVDSDTKISMKNYYGNYAFGHLFPDEQKDLYNPVVDILKPHGSLNWYFIDLQGMQGRILGNLQESEYHLVISNHVLNGPYVDYDLRYLGFLIPPLPEKEIPLINENSPHCSLDCFWKRKKAIKDDIFFRIKEYASSTRNLVIIGYSFPDDDEHIKELFANNRFENVLVFDTNEKVFQRIKEYFPGATAEFKKGGFADVMDWNVGEGFKPSRSE